jgi:cytochrome P450
MLMPPLRWAHDEAEAAGTGTGAASTTTLKTFPKAAFYDLIRPNVGSIRDEAAHRARLRRVGHCFSPALIPGMEPAIHAEIALLLSKMEERRGGVVDVIHWFRMFSLDVACEEAPAARPPQFNVSVPTYFKFYVSALFAS